MNRAGALRAIVGAIALTVFPIATCLGGQNDAAPGQLTIMQKDGKVGGLCPLQKTTVNADITGFGARVVVVQTFTNPSKEPIEAVYTFPLPHEAAVDRMRMRIGTRIVEGEIKRREEARAVYDAAKAAGQTASLLDQERSNIFTQSVANIVPGARIEIEISYVQLLKYEEGQFEFTFPMVVGPRYLGNAPDPGKIAPPITPKGTRSGAGIELHVNLDAGAPITAMNSVLHAVDIQGKVGQSTARIALKRKDEIPNRDFILRYRTATDTVQSAFLTHMDQAKGGFFQFVLLPPKAPKAAQIAPKEVIFLIDQSGSQQGFPIEKSKQLMLKLIDTLRPGDTFNVASFSVKVNWLWPKSKEASPANRAAARKYVAALSGDGGTEMLNAIRAVFANFTKDSGRLPIILFSTDGYVGDDREIIKAVAAERNGARMFTFGIGNGVNRFLIDGMSEQGRGDAEYVTLREEADEAVARLVRRLETPVLTDIRAQFEGVTVTQTLPARIPDVFSDKPIMICGRYEQPGTGSVVVTGKVGGKPWSRRIPLEFEATSDASAIPTLWARREVDHLTLQAPETEAEAGSVRDRIVDVALAFGIMSEFTSFVAVEKKVVNIGGKQRTVAVPVEMTEGVSYEGIFGNDAAATPSTAAGSLVFAKRSVRRISIGKSYGGAAGSSRGRSTGGPADSYPLAEEKLATVANGEKITDNAKAANYTRKVAKKLHTAKGQVEVQILVKAIDAANLEKLAALGFKVDAKDDSLKVLFGTCDAKKLLALSQLEFVKLISPL